MMPLLVENVYNVTFIVDGDVVASSDNINWPNHTDWHMAKHANYSMNSGRLGGSDFGPVISFWEFHDSDGLQFRGSGQVDGQGYWWWMRDYLVLNHGNRPHLLRMDRVRNVRIEGIRWVNSPMYHLFLIDIDNFYIADFEIFVDVYEQKKLAQRYGKWDYNQNIPTFPLNTDGIDPSGTNIYIRNVTITNFDDAVAVKPANGGYKVATCAQNILVEDCKVTWSVGMTIGSVPPHIYHACIKDVTFRNVNFTSPLKAIYVKTNPGNAGDGEITNILYENIKMTMPVWWGIYIGPQQQYQPDGDGPGCMLYPILPHC
jgi:polygalacturonase